jgi:hypothetical protein
MYRPLEIRLLDVVGVEWSLHAMRNPRMSHDVQGLDSDLSLASRLVKAGDEHAKAIRGILAYYDMTFQIGWMLEWDTYRIGVEVLSTSSTMHGQELKGEEGISLARKKQEMLPKVVYKQTGYCSYQALRRIYQQRRKHRHPDWTIFCQWIESLPYFSLLIYPESRIDK